MSRNRKLTKEEVDKFIDKLIDDYSNDFELAITVRTETSLKEIIRLIRKHRKYSALRK